MIRFFRSPTRIALGYVVLSVAALALFALPLWYGWQTNLSTFRAYVQGEETQKLVEVFDQAGAKGLVATLESATANLPRGEIRFLADPQKSRLAGNLPAWPKQVPDAPGVYGLVVDVASGGTMRVVVSHLALPGGYHLLVGRESARFESLVGIFWYGIAGVGVIVLVLGAGIGWLVRRALHAEQALQRAHEDLEGTVAQRTSQLARANESLRLSEERYALAMKATGSGYWDWIFSSSEYYASPRFLEMHRLPLDSKFANRTELVARIPFHPEDKPKWEQALAAFFAGRETRLEMDLRLVFGGEIRWFHMIGLLSRDASGAPERWSGSTTDITERKRAEEALQLSEQRHALAMEAAGDGHTDWIIPTDRFYASSRALEISGMPPGTTFASRAEWISKFPFHPGDRPAWERAVNEHLARGVGRFEMEIRILPRGELRWIKLSAICSRDAAGNPVRWSASLTDVTERKRAEKKLRLSEARYARAMEATDEGHFEWDVVTDDIFVSARVNQMFGYAADKKYAKRSDFVAHAPYHPDDVEHVMACARAGLAGSSDRNDFEYRIVPRPGVVRWMRARWKIGRDANAVPLSVTGVLTDITERKCAEDALRLSEGRYARAMQATEEGHFEWDVASDDFFVSARVNQMLGLAEDETHVRRAEFIARAPYHPDDRQRVIDWAETTLAGVSERGEIEYRYVPRPGAVRWMRARWSLSRDRKGSAVRVTGVLTDITDRKEAEAALRESEERFALAIAGTNDGIFDWDLVTDRMFMSDRAQEFFGVERGPRLRPRAEWMRLTTIPEEDVQRARRALVSHLRGEAPAFYTEYRLPLPEGRLRWLRMRGIGLRNPSGRVYRMAGSLEDITERKLAAEALRQSEERYALVMKASGAGHFDWKIASDEFYVSPRQLEIYGVAPDATWKSRQEFIALLQGAPEDKLRYEAVLAEHFAGKSDRFELELPFRRRGENRWLHFTGICLRDPSGAPIRWAGSTIDITERKCIEEELRSRQEMLDLAQRAARAVAFDWHIDAKEGENPWSPDLEAMYGLSPGSYDGTFKGWKNLIHPEDWPSVREAIHHADETGDVAAEYRVIHPGGAVRWLQAKGKMLFDDAGKPDRLIGFMLDVTDRHAAEDEVRRLERQLRQAQRLEAMGTLAGGIAHDFNNILGAILGYGEMALRDAPKGTRLRRDLESIATAAERGRALVDRILAFSRSGVGERVAVNVEKVVRESIDLLAASLPANITIRPVLHSGSAAMQGDPTQVHQVLMNLATNAVQAMASGGTLRVSLRMARLDEQRVAATGIAAPGEYIVLEVADEGVGIPDQILDRIFDPFFTTKEVGTGTGLGLSLVHGIVTEVGGAIDVATTVGEGSVFTVYLPRSRDAVEEVVDQMSEMPRGDGQRVLVVDDEEPLVRLTTETLEELGYAPVGFTSSTAALEAFHIDPKAFDAVITDERMPGLSGSALIRELRRARRKIPILLVSGYVGATVTNRAYNAGADEVLKKPLSARDLATTLARVLHA